MIWCFSRTLLSASGEGCRYFSQKPPEGWYSATQRQSRCTLVTTYCNKVAHLARNRKSKRKDKSDRKDQKMRIATESKSNHGKGLLLTLVHHNISLRIWAISEMIGPVSSTEESLFSGGDWTNHQ